MLREFSISGRRRSTSGLGGGKFENGSSLGREGGRSGQWKRKVSMIQNEMSVSIVGNGKERAGGREERHNKASGFFNFAG
jgi:hypothetical protein